MMTIIAMCSMEHGVDKFVCANSKLLEKLFVYTVEAVRPVLESDPLHLMTHGSIITRAMTDSMGIHSTFLREHSSQPCRLAQDVAESLPISFKNTDCLVVAPTAGPVSVKRLKNFVRFARTLPGEPAFIRSVYPVSINCNPVWLKCVFVSGRHSMQGQLSGDIRIREPKITNLQGTDLTLSAPKGSQWLPKFFQYDGAATIIRNGGSQNVCHHHPYQIKEDLPFLYKLPIFQIHNSQSMGAPLWDRHQKALMNNAASRWTRRGKYRQAKRLPQ